MKKLLIKAAHAILQKYSPSALSPMMTMGAVAGAPVNSYSMQLEKLATSIDMKPDTERVDDQELFGSCVAHAGQSTVETMFHRAGKATDFSRMYLYYYVQERAGTLGTTSGGHTSQIGAIFKDSGACLETTWKYDKTLLGVKPSEAAIHEARAMFPEGSVEFNPVYGLDGIKRALNQGKPVCITIYVHTDFYYLGKNWRTHKWNTSTNPEGLHAVSVIGYDDEAQRLLVENSWGPNFGDGGFFGIPYDQQTFRQIVLDGYAFDKLPVDIIPVPDYVPESPPEFFPDTNILTLPSLAFYPGNWAGPTLHRGVVVKILDQGLLSVDSERVIAGGSYFLFETAFGKEQLLALPKVKLGNEVYNNVLLNGAKYELISAGTQV